MSHPIPASSFRTFSRRAGFTLVELLTVIAIIGILAAIILPVVGQVRRTAKNSQCVGNLRMWGQAVMLYANDNKGNYAIRATATDGVTNAYWTEIHTDRRRMLYGPYFDTAVNIAKVRTCPGYVTPEGTNPVTCYSMNRPYATGNTPVGTNAISLRAASNPSRLLLMVEIDPDSLSANANPWIIGKTDLKSRTTPMFSTPDKQRHAATVNAVFADGHTAAITSAEVEANGDMWTRL